MENENKIIELLTESLVRQDSMIVELRNVKSEVAKLNLQTSENTRAILKLADSVEQGVNHENRIAKLEKKVFK